MLCQDEVHYLSPRVIPRVRFLLFGPGGGYVRILHGWITWSMGRSICWQFIIIMCDCGGIQYVVPLSTVSCPHVWLIDYDELCRDIHSHVRIALYLSQHGCTHMESLPSRGPPHKRARCHTSFARTSHAHTTWKITFSSFLRARLRPWTKFTVPKAFNECECDVHHSFEQQIQKTNYKPIHTLPIAHKRWEVNWAAVMSAKVTECIVSWLSSKLVARELPIYPQRLQRRQADSVDRHRLVYLISRWLHARWLSLTRFYN